VRPCSVIVSVTGINRSPVPAGSTLYPFALSSSGSSDAGSHSKRIRLVCGSETTQASFW
jgi:hypothetical protein